MFAGNTATMKRKWAELRRWKQTNKEKQVNTLKKSRENSDKRLTKGG